MGNCWPRTATAGCPAAPKPANRPALRASFIPPAAGVIPKEVEGRVHFLIDTGADTTILHLDDGIDLRCPFDALENPAEFVGVGGTLFYYMEPAVLTFGQGSDAEEFDRPISIAKPYPVTEGLDSLPGRDILNRLAMAYHFRRRRLAMAPE